ncbi:MAG: hypothetical protein U9N42_00165, partial [Campylobacterota bacterium]|nr:hypothetical protein [Campylobacterota bacterium]
MKEIDIIKAISKTYIITLNFFIVFLLIVIALYGTLSSGIYIKSFETKTFKVEKLYIKWDKKLQLYLKSADIQSKKRASEYNPRNIDKIVDEFPYITNIVDSIKIDTLVVNSMKFSIDYSDGSGYVSIVGNDFNSSIEANMTKHNLYISSKTNFKKLKSNTEASLNIETHELFVNNRIKLKDIDITTYAKITSKSV